jgi:glycosyltransferase involved in cell wall biosynthesis
MKLSIIIPIYNAEIFIEKLINTINGFTFKDFECIFIDNNSQDNSLVKLKESLASAPFAYSILEEKKQGAGNARNKGIQAAKGEYLAFLDCDDYILPQKFEYDFKILSDYDVDFVFCRGKRFYDDGKVVEQPCDGIKEGVNEPPFLGITWLSYFFSLQGTGSFIVKKTVIEDLKGFHSTMSGEDAFLFIKLGLQYKGYFYNKFYFHYLRHKQSTISIFNQDKNSALKRYFELRQNLFNDKTVQKYPLAMSILTMQIQLDILKLHRLGHDIKQIKGKQLSDLKLSWLLFNPLSLLINRIVPNIRQNPFFQIEIKIRKRNWAKN